MFTNAGRSLMFKTTKLTGGKSVIPFTRLLQITSDLSISDFVVSVALSNLHIESVYVACMFSTNLFFHSADSLVTPIRVLLPDILMMFLVKEKYREYSRWHLVVAGFAASFAPVRLSVGWPHSAQPSYNLMQENRPASHGRAPAVP